MEGEGERRSSHVWAVRSPKERHVLFGCTPRGTERLEAHKNVGSNDDGVPEGDWGFVGRESISKKTTQRP